MNRLGRNQRELHIDNDSEQLMHGMSAQIDAGLVAKMVAEVIAAKCAWAVQLDMMIQQSNHEEMREILRLIRLEELKHVKLLRGLALASEGDSAAWENWDGVLGYARAAKLKLKSAEFVRRIYYVFSDIPTRDILFEIICDDANNAVRFTLLAMESN